MQPSLLESGPQSLRGPEHVSLPKGGSLNAQRLSRNQPARVAQPLPKLAGNQGARRLGSSYRWPPPCRPCRAGPRCNHNFHYQGTQPLMLAAFQILSLPGAWQRGRLQNQRSLYSDLCPATQGLCDLEQVAEPLWTFFSSSIKWS